MMRLVPGFWLACLPSLVAGQPAPGPPPAPPSRPFDLGTQLPAGPQIAVPDKAPATPAPAPPATAVAPVAVPPVPPGSAVQAAVAAAAAKSTPAPAPDNFVSKLRGWLTPSDRGADDEEDEWPRRTPGQRASLNTEPAFDPDEKPDTPGLSTDPGVSTKCLPPVLQTVLQKVVARYGSAKVTSTYRPAWRARRGSYHRRCEAVDFRVPGVRPGEVLALVKTYEETGGHKVYWNGLIHVDTGPYRTWFGSRR